MQRRERPELLGDHERRMVRQHDPAGADANRLRARRDVRDHDRRRGARDARGVVMLGEPEAPVAPALRVLREIERVAKRARDRPAFDDRREIQDGERRNDCVRCHAASASTRSRSAKKIASENVG